MNAVRTMADSKNDIRTSLLLMDRTLPKRYSFILTLIPELQDIIMIPAASDTVDITATALSPFTESKFIRGIKNVTAIVTIKVNQYGDQPKAAATATAPNAVCERPSPSIVYRLSVITTPSNAEHMEIAVPASKALAAKS